MYLKFSEKFFLNKKYKRHIHNVPRSERNIVPAGYPKISFDIFFLNSQPDIKRIVNGFEEGYRLLLIMASQTSLCD